MWKPFLKALAIFMAKASIVVITLIFIFLQYRHFYQINAITFTVWKKWEGKCYITPYPYLGFYTPQQNYIQMSNLGEIDIFIDQDSTLLIFNEEWGEGALNNVKCYFPNYKYKHFYLDSLSTKEETKTFLIERAKYRKTLPSIFISAKSMWVETQNTSQP